MSKREEFIEVINTFKTVSTSITDIQRRGLLKQAVQNYGLSVEEGTEILRSLGLVVGEEIDYFEALGLSMEEIQGLEEQTIVNVVESAHEQCYKASLRAGARVRPDGKTEDQWRNVLNQARDTLVDTQKRQEYLAAFLLQQDSPDITPHDLPKPENEFQDADPTPTNDIENVSSVDSVSVAPNVDVPDSMVFIPAGEFQMGSQDKDENDGGIITDSVYLGPFFIDKYPVTNSQYKNFLNANPQWQKKRIPDNYHDGNYLQTWSGNNYPRGKAGHPVVDVSWYAAMAYAEWAGKRLPIDAEWEKAARGGLIGEIYPWGNEIDIDMANYGMHIGRTTPVGEYPPNDYGVYDMVGNVWEWCLDEYDHSAQRRNPGLIIASISEIATNYLTVQTARIVRGGSWASSERATQVDYCGCADPTVTYYSYGFRCVKVIDK